MDDRIQLWNDLAAQIGVDSIRCTTAAGSGHPTSSLSCAHLLAVLYADHLRTDVADPNHVANDRFVMSKGHAAPILYAAWAEAQGMATAYQHHANAQALRDAGTYPVLTPRQLLEHIEAAGPWDTVLFHPLAGGMDPELAWRSLRLFEEKVYPHTALGKSRREGI